MSRVFVIAATLLLISAYELELQAQLENPGTILKTGDAVPVFKVATIDGKTLSSKGLKGKGKGKKLLVLFFSTYCRACRAELQYFKEHLDSQKRKGLVVVAIGRDSSVEELREFRNAQKLDFELVADPKRQLFKRFAKSQVPRTYLFDKRGRLLHQTRNFLVEQCDEVLRHIVGSMLK